MSEKFFIITEESGLHKEYFDYWENMNTVNLCYGEFTSKNNIEAKEYHPTTSSLYIIPTEKDLENFDKQLKKPLSNGLREFKANSKIRKEWEKFLSSKGVTVLGKPFIPFYFRECAGKTRSRVINIEGVLYCSFEAEGYDDIKTPKGFVDIKASEFFKVIEEYEEKMRLKKEEKNNERNI